MTKFGYEDADWDLAKREAVKVLGDYANKRQMIPYSEFVPYITAVRFDGPHDPRLFHFLGEISADEARRGRGMLTALVVHKGGDFQPGPGFFELAKELGHEVDDIEKFWIQEVKRVFEAWA